jgi:hypothetical protein
MAKHTINNTPNTIQQQYKVLTSFDSGLSTTDDFGMGSIKKRDVATNVALYKPFDNSLDTIIQLTAGFEEVSQNYHEWFEEDEYNMDEAASTAGPAGTAASDDFTIPAGATDADPDVRIFRKGDRIRYVGTGGDWVYAIITDIPDGTTITVKNLASGNLVAQSTSNRLIQRLDSLRGSDLNYEPQPRGFLPRMYRTVVRKMVYDDSYTPRFTHTDNYIDMLVRKEQKLYGELRRGRELGILYGNEFVTDITSRDGDNDKLYVTNGLYDSIDAFNNHSLDTTDATTFKNSLYSFIEHNFGGESGGPSTRQMFISGRFGSLLSQVFEDKQRFYDTEFVAGVRCMRFEHNLGNIDFFHLPIFEYKHPIVGGSLKEGAGKAVGLMVPVEECVTRLVFKGEGPSTETFKERGGDELEYMRVKSTEGIKVRLKQYCATLEEA